MLWELLEESLSRRKLFRRMRARSVMGRFAGLCLNPAALAAAFKLIVGDFDIAVRGGTGAQNSKETA